MIDSQPELAPVIRRVRGGYLKIQGTWMPYEVSAPVATISPRSSRFVRSPFACLDGMCLHSFSTLDLLIRSPRQCCMADT